MKNKKERIIALVLGLIGLVANKEISHIGYFGLFIGVTFYLFGFIELVLVIGQSRVLEFFTTNYKL